MSDGGGTALVVDDDFAIRFMLIRVLRDLGLSAVGFGSGESALSWISVHGAPRLISCDLVLPRLSGFGLCDLLRRMTATSRTPIIILSGRVDAADDAAHVGELDAIFLKKPVRLNVYRDTVRGLL